MAESNKENLGAMSPETEKILETKLKFKNKILEGVDGIIIPFVDNNLLAPLMKKFDEKMPEGAAFFRETLAEVINEMDVTEI